jgi:hypothetical protein
MGYVVFCCVVSFCWCLVWFCAVFIGARIVFRCPERFWYGLFCFVLFRLFLVCFVVALKVLGIVCSLRTPDPPIRLVIVGAHTHKRTQGAPREPRDNPSRPRGSKRAATCPKMSQESVNITPRCPKVDPNPQTLKRSGWRQRRYTHAGCFHLQNEFGTPKMNSGRTEIIFEPLK